MKKSKEGLKLWTFFGEGVEGKNRHWLSRCISSDRCVLCGDVHGVVGPSVEEAWSVGFNF